MTDAQVSKCPVMGATDKRKSAKLAIANTQPDNGAHWVKNPDMARRVLRSKASLQAGASADQINLDNPEHASVFFLDGDEHFKKRQKTQRFLSPKAVADQHYVVMEKVTNQLLGQFQRDGKAKLDDLSFTLAIEVVGEILGLTESDEMARAKRIQRVLESTMGAPSGFRGKIFKIKRALHNLIFFTEILSLLWQLEKNRRKMMLCLFMWRRGIRTKPLLLNA